MQKNLILIGKGNVGSCFLSILEEKKEELKKKFNISYKVIAIFEYDGGLIKEDGINIKEVLEKDQEFRTCSYWKKDVKAIDYISKLNIDILIETTPTNPNTGEPALSHITNALKKKINVVASNKGPFYLQYKKIHELASRNDAIVKYEATVASCVPALAIKQGMLGSEVTSIKAILNGTCNYILSRMASEGVTFSIALKEAQELGYAETDPSLDIEGYDAAGKLVILANEILGWSKTIKDVKIVGISEITTQALELAKMDGYVIKHLAIAEDNELLVEPRLIKSNSPLNISGTLNVIELYTKHAGPIILMGRGAGGPEAASAILNDILAISKEKGYFKL